MKLLRAAAAALAICASTSIGAAPLNYDESVSGDIPMNGSVMTLPIDLGLNTIKGQMHAFSNQLGEFDSDFDPIQLNLPDGLRVTGMSVTLANMQLVNLQNLVWQWGVLAGPPYQQTIDTCFVIVAPNPFCTNVAPTGGQLGIQQPVGATSVVIGQGATWLWDDFQQWSGSSFDYTLTITVAQVPEPSTLVLALAGLVLALGRRRSVSAR
ncbi:PEP-CTERM sorting domain-containing protein [Aquabacterium humicola]|uniref:PEP-CTERM sorting domain-containing protein n=1 Tax=Aquabacterium humicola TaxID=3237377 RepID=UPI00254365DF|nr:PEP-CTERM sorting domain-containing protein [Rubrivivax pictus]